MLRGSCRELAAPALPSLFCSQGQSLLDIASGFWWNIWWHSSFWFYLHSAWQLCFLVLTCSFSMVIIAVIVICMDSNIRNICFCPCSKVILQSWKFAGGQSALQSSWSTAPQSTNRGELVETPVTFCDSVTDCTEKNLFFRMSVMHSWHYTAFKQPNVMPTIFYYL